jgi:DNA mismatch repair protein MutS
MAPFGFKSILFESAADRARTEHAEAPSSFADLNLDQITDAITADWAAYNLKPFFYVPLNRLQAISYRHEVMHDLESASLLSHINAFAAEMRAMRDHLAYAAKLRYQYQKDARFLDAADIYCRAVRDLADNLRNSAPGSRGLLQFLEHLGYYVASHSFVSLAEETKSLRASLKRVRYCIQIKGSSFTVYRYQSERDYSAEVEKTFDKFARGAAKDYRIKYRTAPEMNHIEAKILDYVAALNPELFADLDEYCARNKDFTDATIVEFDREVHFYIAYLGHAAKLRRYGLQFCYPQFSAASKAVRSREAFDLALAAKLGGEQKIVCNDFYLQNNERIIVVTGPNQGGKTTFARMFGQLHYLGSLGCPVPGQEARLVLFDNLLTHFEREERIDNLRGKLQDDLVRIRKILDHATPNSIVILNEIFTSTTIQDATFLSRKIMGEIAGLDLLGVWVTFIDELASCNDKTVSMASMVSPQDPTLRTFKVVRKPADGLSYALSIAEKYRLTYAQIKERIAS